MSEAWKIMAILFADSRRATARPTLAIASSNHNEAGRVAAGSPSSHMK